MAGTPVRRASDEAAFSIRFELRGRWLVGLLPVLLVGGLLAGGAASVSAGLTPPAGVASTLSPAAPLTSVTCTLERATANGGIGYTVEVLQAPTVAARPCDPRIAIPDALNPTKGRGTQHIHGLQVLALSAVAERRSQRAA